MDRTTKHRSSREGDTSGSDRSASRLLPLVYEELHRLAHRRLAKEPRGITLQTTDLVHEAYLRLVKSGTRWENRAHFFAAAAIAMRRILVELARKKAAARHGGGWRRVSFEGVCLSSDPRDPDLLLLDEALTRLESFDKRLGEIVMLRFFAGLGIEEAAAALGLSPATVKRDWTYAKTWLHREMMRRDNPDAGGGA